ncbi:hypothetical protein [Streptomyces sp. NPDC050988]|uniref:hypothetical protein n=1 Tax=Streptomyces sp. NPDC050988 TaxID=3365637 RepID=UPI0037914E0E
MTESLRRSCLEAEDIAELAKRIRGSVLAPDDAGYADVIAAFNLRSQHRPGWWWRPPLPPTYRPRSVSPPPTACRSASWPPVTSRSP